MLGVIVRVHGYTANRTGLYSLEDTVNAVFRLKNGLTGNGAQCSAAHESACEDRIEIYGPKGRFSLSVYTYASIHLYISEGERGVDVANPAYVQLPIIKSVTEDIQGYGVCDCTSVNATPTNWVADRIFGEV